MASKAVVDAVKARIAANWTTLPVYGPNERMKAPDDKSPFVDIEFPVSIAEQKSIGSPGSNVYREEGVFRLLIAAKRNDGTDNALTWADELAALFRGKNFSGMQTFAPNPPVMDQNNDSAAYWVVAVAVPYHFDIFG